MKKYDGMCYRCYAHLYPDDPKVRTKERAEDTVKVYINAHFKNFVHDQKMPTAHCNCNHLRRIDHRQVVGNTLLCVETDEHHHIYYKKDDTDTHYHDMLMGWGGKLCFVRFNPDDEGPPMEERLERLRKSRGTSGGWSGARTARIWRCGICTTQKARRTTTRRRSRPSGCRELGSSLYFVLQEQMRILKMIYESFKA